MARRFFILMIIAAMAIPAVVGCGPRTTAPVAPPPPDTNQPTSEVPPAAPRELEKAFVQTIPKTLVEFEMLLVPGDEAQGIEPFYIGKHEVSWAEFAPWALCEGIPEKKVILLIDQELRPSLPHDVQSIFRGWGRANQPAVGMSRLSAQKYCDWLSEETGRRYRLPTVAEWEHAFELGGLKIDEALPADALKKIAWHAENSLDQNTFDNRAMPLGSLEPSALGVHDMLGNVAEWVTGTGDKFVVRGGHFRTPAEQLRGQHEEVEDQAVWNKNYPNTPKSKWGYVDADFPGIRLVCEPESSK